MMETFALYLLRSVAWLSGFALVYILFLRDERFFELNRIFLLSGIMAALILPFITVSYNVVLPVVTDSQSQNAVVSTVQDTTSGISRPDYALVLLYLYLAGLLVVAFMIIQQGRSLLKVISKAGIDPSNQVKLVKTADYPSAFSFFSYVFVNPSITEIEMREIMNHEMVHIRQKHWFDLMLLQLLCVLQWFNPVIWIYIRLVRQNHEYIADKVALQRTSDPAVYKAALLNQIVGSQVISLVNSFNYSVNKKRFTMMKNIISSPYRKMKLLFILPVFALLFYAFAKPDYQYVSQKDNQGSQNVVAPSSDKKVSGTIIELNGSPLPGASVIVLGTTLGSSSDSKGKFSITNVPDDAAIVVTFVGYKSKVIKAEFVKETTIEMTKDTISYLKSSAGIPPPPPPPPPPSPMKIKDTNGGPPPLDQKKDDALFEVTEELPEFPGGGREALKSWISDNLKYPGEAYNKKIMGTVNVGFLVTSTGKIKDVNVLKSVDPLLDAEAKRVISSMPDWKPGSQHGKAVPVQMKVQVEFKF